MPELTNEQIAALRWMRDFPSTRAEWRQNGKAVTGPAYKWNEMLLSGPRASLLVPLADWRALNGLYIGFPEPSKIYGPNEEGLVLLAEYEAAAKQRVDAMVGGNHG